MNVEEVLSYQPSSSVDDEEAETSSGQRPAKRRKEVTLADIDLDALEDAPAPLDEAGLKRLIMQFERKVLKNQELRVKFADNPTKFMDSELELFEVLQEMHILSTQPELYRVLVELKIVQTILGLLSHENTDVACASVALLQELSDQDNVEEAEEIAVLMDALIDGQIVAQLVSNLDRLDETVKEESEGVYNSLAIIENLTDYKPDLSKDSQSLIAWLLKRLRAKIPFEGNKLYTSEILSILIQNNEQNRRILGDLDGIDTMLQQLAYYKRHDPVSGDEHEFMENLFDCLCASLLSVPENRARFVAGEGLELMNLILREKRRPDANTGVRIGALKVINHVFTNDEKDSRGEKEIIEQLTNRFVDLRGLSVVCQILMRPKLILGGTKKKRQQTAALDEIEEHSVSILLAIIKRAKPEHKKRIITKFMESNFEKTERLIELHFKYAEKLNKCDALIAKERARFLAEDFEFDESDVYMRRLSDGGLFSLQLVDQTILNLSSMHEQQLVNEQSSDTASKAEESIKSHIIKLINMHANTTVNHYKLIKTIIRELSEETGNEDEKRTLIELVEQF